MSDKPWTDVVWKYSTDGGGFSFVPDVPKVFASLSERVWKARCDGGDPYRLHTLAELEVILRTIRDEAEADGDTKAAEWAKRMLEAKP